MSTTNLSDGSQATVAAGIAAAAAGDTLVIPAGTWTWSAGVTINKSLTIQGTTTAAPVSPGQGPGVSSSVIIRAGGLNGNTPLIAIAPPTDVPVRVTGLRLDNGWGTSVPSGNSVAITIAGPDNHLTSPLRQIRVDNCYFNTGSQVVWWFNGAYGLVDHCYFNNCWIGVIIYGGNLGDEAFARNDYAAGSLNFPFTEDCIFKWALAGIPGSPWVTYHWGGARSVLRHCLIDAVNAANAIAGPVDCHGNASYWHVPGSTNQRGTIRFEFYNNIVNLGNNIYQIMDARGGSYLIHDNAFTTKDGSTPNIVDFRDEEDDPNNTPGMAVRSPVAWPCEDQVTASFIWNNTLNGVPTNTAGVGNFGNPSATVGDPFYIKVNRDFWLKAPDGTTTTVYPSPPNGQTIAAYPTPFASLQTTSYTPAVYPHPLNINTGGGGTGGSGGSGGGTGGGGGGGTSNPPFQQVGFAPGPPTVPVWEDGPGFFVSPSNTGTPVRYSGQGQSRTIYTANPRPPAMTLPGAAVGMSALPVPPAMPVTPPSTPYTLGDTTVEASFTPPTPDTLGCVPIQVVSASHLVSMAMWFSGPQAASSVRLGIYTGNATQPSNRVAEMTGPISVIANSWNILSAASPVALSPGTYWLVFSINSGNVPIAYKGVGAFYTVASPFANPMPATMPGGGNTAITATFSLYANLLLP